MSDFSFEPTAAERPALKRDEQVVTPEVSALRTAAVTAPPMA